MQLKFGAYEFQSNTCHIATKIETLWNSGGQAYGHRHIWEVTGYLFGDGQNACSAAQNNLVLALQHQRKDLIFYHDDGSESASVLKNAGSISGVRIIKGPDFVSKAGSEYVVEREFSFTAEATYPVTGAAGLLLSFTETISIGGGFPSYICRPAINAPPQRQKLYFSEPYYATQTGSAKGYRDYPEPPAIMWPFALKKSPKIDRVSPQRDGPNKYEGFLVTWEFSYESPSPLIGLPNRWR